MLFWGPLKESITDTKRLKASEYRASTRVQCFRVVGSRLRVYSRSLNHCQYIYIYIYIFFFFGGGGGDPYYGYGKIYPKTLFELSRLLHQGFRVVGGFGVQSRGA